MSSPHCLNAHLSSFNPPAPFNHNSNMKKPNAAERGSPSLRPLPPSSLTSRILRVLAVLASVTAVIYGTPVHLLPWSALLLFSAASVTLLFSFLLYRTFTYPNRQLPADSVKLPSACPAAFEYFHSHREELCERLAAAIRIPTVSHDDRSKVDHSQLLRLHELLERSFPLVHQQLQRTIISQYSLLYKWTPAAAAAQPSSSLLPVLFLAHLDVVPVPDADEWRHPPFSGAMVDGRVWGRGAIDNKNNLFAVLEAVEYLLQRGLSLQHRTVYLAFGHDEETFGTEGAASIAAHLRRQGLTFEFCYDEGLFIIDKIVPHYPRPVALICTAEKGYCTAEVKVSLAAEHAGHSAAPAATSAIAILSRALLRLHERKTPSYYGVKDRVMMEWLAHGFPLPVRVIVSNLWLFAPLMRRIMASKPQTAATVRTTTALTVLSAGEKSNVIPTSASALVNHRLHPADSVAGILQYDRHVICDHRVVVQQRGEAVEPSAVSSDSSTAFRALHESVLAVYPHVSVAPAVVVGGTDSKHYASLCRDLYRFSCIYMTDPSQTALFHGRDERIEQDNYVKIVCFYLTLLLKCDQQHGQAEGEDKKQR